MPRVAGVDIPAKKRIEIALTYVFGIGRSRSQAVLEEAGIDGNIRAEALSEEQMTKIRNLIDSKFPVEGNLRREVAIHIKRLMDLGTYRGLRHKKSLPVRGQRSKTNARTRKGPRKTVAGKKKAVAGK